MSRLLDLLARWACPAGTVSAAWDIDSQMLDTHLDADELRTRATTPRPLPPYRRPGAGGHRPEVRR